MKAISVILQHEDDEPIGGLVEVVAPALAGGSTSMLFTSDDGNTVAILLDSTSVLYLVIQLMEAKTQDVERIQDRLEAIRRG